MRKSEVLPGPGGYAAPPELTKAIAELRKQYPDSDLLRLLYDTICLKQADQYNVFFIADVALQTFVMKKKKRMINADAKLKP